MPDLFPEFVVVWFMQDPLRALAIVACAAALIWAVLNPNFTCDGEGGGMSDGCSGDGGD